MKSIQTAWAVSLIVIGLGAVAIGVSRLLPGAVPDGAVRLAGVLDLAALPVLVYTTVRKIRAKS